MTGPYYAYKGVIETSRSGLPDDTPSERRFYLATWLALTATPAIFGLLAYRLSRGSALATAVGTFNGMFWAATIVDSLKYLTGRQVRSE